MRMLLRVVACGIVIAGCRGKSDKQSAGDAAVPPPGSAAATAMPVTQASWGPDAVDELVAPIALYPDQLVGQILAASVNTQEVLDAGKRSGEPGWPLPLWEDYKELIKSDIADIKNSGGRPAGTISAAMFLREFAEGYPWVHLDIAGTAYTESDLATIPAGPTGVPVGTFVEFVRGRAG